MENELLGAGAELMLVGMGTVLFFLTALIGATSLMSLIVMRFEPESGDADVEAEQVAAITAAITRYRQERRNR